MKSTIKKLLRERVILNESGLYGKNIINTITKKIQDSSEDTLNKLAIVGLFRDLDLFKNVQRLQSKEELDRVFKNWYDTTIKSMVDGTKDKSNAFLDDENQAKRYLDAYIENIRSLENKAKPFSLKNLEKTLVDLVNHPDNKWLGDEQIIHKHSIYKPKDEDVVYEDENVVILNADTKAKCVLYGSNESWCISKAQLNFYNTYRINYRATPYFVLQKNEKYPEHKIVIMHYAYGYAIADQSNDPSKDRHGGGTYSNAPWSEIEKELPNLKGLEEYFPYREVTDDERIYSEVLSKKFEGDDLQGYIDEKTSNLIINKSKVKGEDFIRDFAAKHRYFTDEQIKSLRPSLVDSLIEGGYFLTYTNEKQVEFLSDKQKLRLLRIKVRNGDWVSNRELDTLPLKEQHQYILNISPSDLKYRYSIIKDIEGYEEPTSTQISKLPKESLLDHISESPYNFNWEGVLSDETKGWLNNLTPNEALSVIQDTDGNITEMNLEKLSEIIKNRSTIEALASKKLKESGSDYNPKLYELRFFPKKDQKNILYKFLGDKDSSEIEEYDVKQILVNYHDTDEAIEKIGEDRVKEVLEDNTTSFIIIERSENPVELFKKLSKYFKERLLDYYLHELILDSKYPIQFINLIKNSDKYVGGEVIQKFGVNEILGNGNLLIKIISKFKEKSKPILDAIGFEIINTLSDYAIKYMIINSDNPGLVITYLGKDIINKLPSYKIIDIIQETKKPISVTKGLRKVIEDKLDGYDIASLIRKSKRPKSLIDALGEANLDKLDSFRIAHMINTAKKPIEVIEGLPNNIKNKIDKYDTSDIIHTSKEPSEVIKALGKESIQRLIDEYGLGYIISNVNDDLKDSVKKALSSMGFED